MNLIFVNAFFILLLLFLETLLLAQGTLFANSLVIASKKDGISWADAFLTIHDALQVSDAAQ